MSNSALLASPAPVRHLRAVPDVAARPAAPAPAAPATAAPATGSVPAGTAPRGFALYVGIDEAKAAAAGVSLSTLVEALRRTLGELAPHAETYATVALAPAGKARIGAAAPVLDQAGLDMGVFDHHREVEGRHRRHAAVRMPRGLSPLGQKVFRTYQRYGVFVIDVAEGVTNLRAQSNAYDEATIAALQIDLGRISRLLQRVKKP